MEHRFAVRRLLERPTRKLRLTSLVLATTALAALVGALASSASAKPRTTYIVRDGMYAGLAGDNTYAMFWIKHRRVYHLRFSAMLQCYDIASHEEYPREFDAGKNMPQGREIPRNGRLVVDFVETEAGREGHIRATISLRHAGLAEFSIDAPHVGEGLEDCTGFQAIRIKRSPHNIPIPAGP